MDATSKIPVMDLTSFDETDHSNMDGKGGCDGCQNSRNSTSSAVYGALVIIGYNGQHPDGDKGRRKSYFFLKKRPVPNGVQPSRRYDLIAKDTNPLLLKEQHSVSFTLSRTKTVVVEYSLDEETDMFQIGRSSEPPIDFVVTDIVPGNKQKLNIHGGVTPSITQSNSQSGRLPQSTISRFACRILVERKPPYKARLYAAGFDSNRKIVLGEKATKWETETGEMDGLTTNGILLMHPHGSFLAQNSGMCSAGMWREVSVGGTLFSLRESRSSANRGERILGESNELKDGSLIDLCGTTLLWRSAEGMQNSPSTEAIEKLVDSLNACRPQCPVGLNTLVLPRRGGGTLKDQENQPYVYLNCGHVQGSHEWGVGQNPKERKCPICMKEGKAARLQIGLEAAFYRDTSALSHAFNPCAHLATEGTVKYWALIPIPHGTKGFIAACPYCTTPLEGNPGYVRLIFQDNLD
ncbi:protein pellino-like [Artemia franciscana]|uniref:Protein pellino n=1 Tax=Artemia franciscana TaxID=6661 RepID=A0AA88L8U9_ARTSF|nr:hypothetical protein QYM36_006995 [Artemia franciscana]KAK2716697.1 hypothetical protein QYM36_006995 [Artemia franciscana]